MANNTSYISVTNMFLPTMSMNPEGCFERLPLSYWNELLEETSVNGFLLLRSSCLFCLLSSWTGLQFLGYIEYCALVTNHQQPSLSSFKIILL